AREIPPDRLGRSRDRVGPDSGQEQIGERGPPAPAQREQPGGDEDVERHPSPLEGRVRKPATPLAAGKQDGPRDQQQRQQADEQRRSTRQRLDPEAEEIAARERRSEE